MEKRRTGEYEFNDAVCGSRYWINESFLQMQVGLGNRTGGWSPHHSMELSTESITLKHTPGKLRSNTWRIIWKHLHQEIAEMGLCPCLRTNIEWTEVRIYLRFPQPCPGGPMPAEFYSNPNQTHPSKLTKVFRIPRKSQVSEFELTLQGSGPLEPNLRNPGLYAGTDEVSNETGASH